MKCEEMNLHLIEAASGGEAPDAEAKAHLQACAACRGKAEDMRQFVDILRLAGRQERERSERKKREAIARMRAEFARQDRAEAEAVKEASGPGPAAPVTRAWPRVLRAAIAFPFAAAAAVYLAVNLARRLEFVPPTREEAAKGWVEVACGNGRETFPLAHTMVWGEPGSAFRVRVWESEAAFGAGEDASVREWAAAAGLLAAGWPIVEVHVKQGTVLLENVSGRVPVGPGARAFATTSWLPFVKESAEGSPKLASVEGIVEGVPGAIAVEAYELGDPLDERDWKPVRRVPVDEYSQFSLPLLCGRVYLIVPRAGDGPLAPDRVAVVVAGQDPDPEGSETNGRAVVPLDVGIATHRVEAGAKVRTTLALRRAGTVEGTVRDRAGKPLPGTKVRIRARGDNGFVFGREVEAGTDGSFRAPGISGRFKAEATGAGDLRVWVEGEVEAGATATVDLVLAPLGPLFGFVVGSDGRPLDGALVWVLRAGEGGVSRLAAPEAVTNRAAQVTAEDGSFRIESGLEAGPCRILAEAGPSHAGWSEVVDPLRGPAEVRVVARFTPSIAGRLTDEEGGALRGVVHLWDPDRPDLGRAHAKTDRDGRYAFRHLEPGEYLLEVWAPGRPVERRSVAVASASETADFTLPREGAAPGGGPEGRPGSRPLGFDGPDLRFPRGGGVVRVRLRRPDGESHLPEQAVLPGVEDWARVRSMLDVHVALLRVDPRAAQGPIPWNEMIQVSQSTPGTDAIDMLFPQGTDRAWLALQVCGAIAEAREVGVGDEVLFPVDLPAEAMGVGGMRILVLDAETGASIPVPHVEAFRDGTGIPWVLGPFRGEAFGPLRAGEYEVVVEATGYGKASLGRVRIEAGKAAGPFTVELRRER